MALADADDDGPELAELEPHPMAGTAEVCGAAAAVDGDDDGCGVAEGPPSRESPPPDLSIVLLLILPPFGITC